MKREILKSLREKNDADLLNNLKTDKDNLWQLKMDLAAGKVKNVSEIRKVRERIAIINTLIKEFHKLQSIEESFGNLKSKFFIVSSYLQGFKEGLYSLYKS